MLEKINHKSAPKEVVNALVTLYHQGKFDDVLSRSSQLIKEYPETFVLHNIIGAISFEKGQKEVAIEHFRKVIELRPHHPHAYNNLGAALMDIGEYEEAKSNLKKAIELQPDYAEAYNNLGNVYKEMEEYNQAISVYEKAIELNPEYYEAYNNLGVALGKNEQYEEAEKVLKQVIKLQPDLIDDPKNFISYFYLGSLYHDNNDFKNAIIHYKKSVKLNPNYFNSWFKLGITSNNFKKPYDAIHAYEKALEINPNHVETLNNLGTIHHYILQYEKSIEYYKQAIKSNPHFNILYSNLALAYKDSGDIRNSIKYYKLAIEKNPHDEVPLNQIGQLFRELNNLKNASIYFINAIELKPNSIPSNFNLACTLIDMGIYNHAKNYLNKIIKIDREFVKAHLKLGEMNFYLGFYDKGLYNFLNAVDIGKELELSFSLLNFYINYSPDMSAKEIFDYYKQYDQRFGLPLKSKWKSFPQPKTPKQRLKIGYVSPDFKQHSMQNFLMPTLSYHNHQKFEIFAFAELKEEDKVSLEYKSHIDHWIRTEKMNDDKLVQKIRSLGIDILVDLAGHTKNNRLGVFAQKPAPVSLSWLGYGYTTGLSAIDYFLTDKVMVPKGSEHLFSEQPWRLKQNYSFCCYQAKPDMGEVHPLPALANNFVTFGSVSKNLRINSKVISIWSSILKRVKNSKLLINNFDMNNKEVKRNNDRKI